MAVPEVPGGVLPRGDCELCALLPDRLAVDTLQAPDAFPAAARRLEPVAGERSEGQVQRCPNCGAHFLYTFDHDSESGVGYGYTEETLERLFWFETRADRSLILHNASTGVTGIMLGAFIRDLLATGRPDRSRITALEIKADNFGAAPDELGSLAGLDLVWFHPGGVTGLPESIQNLSRLRDLWIAGNPIASLPLGLARVSGLTHIDLDRTAIVQLPDALANSHITFRNTAANVVPAHWRAAFVSEYQRPLAWLAGHGAEIVHFDSGAWSHEDRYALTVRLPGALAMALRDCGELTPFEIVAGGAGQVVLECPGRAGRDRIVVTLVPAE